MPAPRHRQLTVILTTLALAVSCQLHGDLQIAPQLTIARHTVATAFHAASASAQEEAQRQAAWEDQARCHGLASRGLEQAISAGDEAAKTVPPAPPGEVLLLGDSMAWALGIELKPLLEAEGHPFHFKYKVSDSVRAWRGSKAAPLKEALRKHPSSDVVIIVLGSNDYMYPRAEQLRGTLDLVNTLVGDRRCFWIGPPMWRKDNGIVAFLASASAPCHFFNSSELTLKRRSDGIHPNREGSRAWASAVHTWLLETATLRRTTGNRPPQP